MQAIPRAGIARETAQNYLPSRLDYTTLIRIQLPGRIPCDDGLRNGTRLVGKRGNNMTNDTSENKRDNTDKCPECGSNETEKGDTHEHCSNCGIPIEPLELDPGFTPVNPNAKVGDDRGLGGVMGPTNNNFYSIFEII